MTSELAYNRTKKMAYGTDTQLKRDNIEKMYIANNVHRVLDTCIKKDGFRYYKVAWRTTWEREDLLTACENAIQDFWQNVVQEERDTKEENGRSSPESKHCGRRKSKPKKFINNIAEDLTKRVVTSEEVTSHDIMTSPEMEDGSRSPVYSPCSSSGSREEDGRPEEYPVVIIPEPSSAETYEHQPSHVIEPRARSPKESTPTYETESDEPASKKLRTALEQRPILPKIVYLPKSEYPSLKMDFTSKVDVSLPVHPTPVRQPYQGAFQPMNIEVPGYTKELYRPTYTLSTGPQSKPPSNFLLKLSPKRPSPPPKYPIFKASNGEGKRTALKQQQTQQQQPKKHFIDPKQIPVLHVITETGEQRPQCAECFQTFKKRAALERHMMIHRGIKPFQCNFCHQRFRQKHHLQGHVMLHTGERPHSCTLCNKRFRMRHHLLEHERISHKLFR